MPMQKRKKAQSNTIDLQTRNAFRLIKHAATLCGDELTGDLQNLPIVMRYAEDTGVKSVEKMNSHQDVVYYAVELLSAFGFSFEGAFNVVSSAKATKHVMRDMYNKA